MLSPVNAITLLPLLTVPFVSALFFPYRIDVQGKLYCNGTPIAGVQVDLMERDFVKADDVLGISYTGEDGGFKIEATDIETWDPPHNYLRIRHSCTAVKPCVEYNCRPIILHQITARPYNLGIYELWENKGKV
ncbi:unnamed protein product, partial [Mesorhabditis spiculigera]